MSEDVAARLSALAQDFREGRLNLPAYRRLRAPLLDSLATRPFSAEDESTITQPREKVLAQIAASAPAAAAPPASTLSPPLAEPSTSDVIPPPRPAAAPTPDVAPPARKRSAVPLTAGVVTIVALAGIGLWVMRERVFPTPEAETMNAAERESGPVYNIVVPFLTANDWSDRSLARFNAALLELGESEMAAEANTTWFRTLVDEVRHRLKEQQALAREPLTPQKSPLAALAVTIGIDLSSPDSAIRLASEQPAGSSPPPAERAPRPETRTAESSQPAAPPEEAPKQTRERAVASTESSGVPTKRVEPAEAPEAKTDAVASNADACDPRIAGSARPYCRDTLQSGGSGPRLAVIPAGEFDMGSDAAPAEQPVHRVRITRPFAISVNEVSQGEFRLYCERAKKECPAQPWSGDDYPVVNVTWHEAREYVQWLSAETGQRYRLPTEAEWEYAARAGQTGAYPNGDSLSPADAHYSSLGRLTAPARRSQKFNPNGWKLLHVIGNAREWVEDAWVPSFEGAPQDGSARLVSGSSQRVARGGSYADGSPKLRLSTREGVDADSRDALTGFRLVRELPRE